MAQIVTSLENNKEYIVLGKGKLKKQRYLTDSAIEKELVILAPLTEITNYEMYSVEHFELLFKPGG